MSNVNDESTVGSSALANNSSCVLEAQLKQAARTASQRHERYQKQMLRGLKRAAQFRERAKQEDKRVKRSHLDACEALRLRDAVQFEALLSGFASQ
jgi:hypothetical protein